MNGSSAQEPKLRPHQLARELAKLVPERGRVLDFAAGSGRNAAFLSQLGFDVLAVSDDAAAAFTPQSELFDGAITTHGLLHGTPGTIAAMIQTLASCLKAGAPLHATFASDRDVRYGTGRRLGANAFAAIDGEEAGVPHSFFDENGVRDLLSASFEVESLEERDGGHVPGSVHWFVRARRR